MLPEADGECGNPDEPNSGPATPNCTADLAIERQQDRTSTIKYSGPSDDSNSSSISWELQCGQSASAANSAADGDSGMAKDAEGEAGGQVSSAEVPGRAQASGGSIVGGRAVFISASYFNHSCW